MLVVIAGGRAPLKKETIAELDFVTFKEKCQQRREIHIFCRAGEISGLPAKLFAGHLGEGLGRNALWVRCDQVDDVVAVNLLRGHAENLAGIGSVDSRK